ncbi:hypothetical protein K458DRAFT_402331 [Lentithecium fluviatile CBS 122367]|uniref:Uncharacterized protein n=1 Tax=Lentithecium fluviatile CBS 122367 TaxID=1168545 RepID=A0A6G1J975_9PLEO|nr:hypothetical protein K458DRAFT_402331 [Lentithecium fluviatile CBS 122367]
MPRLARHSLSEKPPTARIQISHGPDLLVAYEASGLRRQTSTQQHHRNLNTTNSHDISGDNHDNASETSEPANNTPAYTYQNPIAIQPIIRDTGGASSSPFAICGSGSVWALIFGCARNIGSCLPGPGLCGTGNMRVMRLGGDHGPGLQEICWESDRVRGLRGKKV